MQTQPLTVSELVRADYRLADVFKKWGINYCCGSHFMLDEVCRLQGLDKTKVESDMRQAQQTVVVSNAVSYADWPVDFLTDYIVHVHHAYIKTVAPQLQQALETFARNHEKKYPYFTDIYGAFKKLAAVLHTHMQQEEDVLFPYLRQVNNAWKGRESYGALFVRTLNKSLSKTTGEAQQQTLTWLTKLRETAHQYRFPPDACTNHQVLYHRLEEWDNDLVRHKHLENNILVPKVMQMEGELLQS